MKQLLRNFWENREVYERYIEAQNKRFELESLMLNEQEKEYVRGLISFDRVINSHRHSSSGLYSDIDGNFIEFTNRIVNKISRM